MDSLALRKAAIMVAHISYILASLLLVAGALASSLPPRRRQTAPLGDWATARAKAVAFVNNLTLAEKVSLATGVGWENGACVGNIAPISRVNFPGLCLEDSPTGVRFGDFVSAFPAGINAAATFDVNLIRARAAAMGAEFRGKGVNIALAPMMNMGRAPAGGRNWEGFGGDPYLAGISAAETVTGIQSAGVIATAKHYIGNEQEHYRTTASSNIDDRTIHEIYLWPFAQSVQAGVGSIMCSYNLINNTYACQNDHTLNGLLKGELGFPGFVMSDWSATMNGVPSVLAGLDMTMPGDITFGSGTTYFGNNLVQAVNNGQVPSSRVDDMAIRILTPWYLLGQDSGFPAVNFNAFNAGQDKGVNVEADHYKVIRSVGAASAVLLKNTNGALPLKSSKSIALIGSDAGPINDCTDHGCDTGTLAQGWGSGTTPFPYLITPYQGIQNRSALSGNTVSWFSNDWDLKGAAAAAASANYAIVFSNADSGEGYITVDGNAGDRNNLTLWHNGDNLIEAVAAANPNTIVVLHTVGPVLMPWANNPNIVAIVYALLPGQESGNSLADVLFGDVNPSGRLPHTIAVQASDYPASVLYQSSQGTPQIAYTEGLLIDYRWFDQNSIAPLFPFGHGLSYTTFQYSALSITHQSNPTTVTVRLSIQNTGSVAGAEVAQLYLGFPPSAGEPPKVLRGFDKIFLRAGQFGTVLFTLDAQELSIWSTSAQQWVVPSGHYKIYVGASSRDIRSTGTVTISTSTTITQTATSTTTTTSKTSTTSPTASLTSSNCSPHWSQCGGTGWSGPTCCVSGTTCTYSNPYYSQCL